MSPRAYKPGRRRAASRETRSRIIAAARELLAAEGGLSAFSVEAVARQADVARMTVYYQFGSKAGLLEALFDDLAARARLPELMPLAYSRADPREALAYVIAAFGQFWASDRVVIRRVRALAALDPVVEETLRVRDGWRRGGLEVLVGRLTNGQPADDSDFDQTVDLLLTLTSYQTFDTLAGPTRSPADVVPTVQRLAACVLDILS